MASAPEPANGLTAKRRATEAASLNRVQRRVAAIAFFAFAVHGVFGVIGAAYVLEGQDRHGDAVGLTVMSGVIALIVYVVMRTILGAKLWSPAWIVLAFVPTVAAFIWVV
ncbi:hypothetical protein [Aeromicrobium sp.]|uniref:hypothetical protein n=1 Tax=Aeromicrobium sp. TaxID=1871063 RepID=UPI003D6A7C21